MTEMSKAFEGNQPKNDLNSLQTSLDNVLKDIKELEDRELAEMIVPVEEERLDELKSIAESYKIDITKLKLGSKFKEKTLKNEMLTDILEGKTHNMNLSSLMSVLADLSGEELRELKIALDSDMSKAEDSLEDRGYDNEGFILDSTEMGLIKETVDFYANLQEKATSVSFRGALKILFDLNGDLNIEAGNTPVISEMQALTEIMDKEDPEAALKNLMDNLNLSEFNDVNSIKGALGENLFGFKKLFKERLSLMLLTGTKFEPLLLENGVSQMVSIKFKTLDAFINSPEGKRVNALVENQILKQKDLQKLLSELPADEAERARSQVRLVALGLIVNDYTGVGANFDISRVTQNIFDTFHLGAGTDGFGFGFGVTKRLHENVSLGIMNFQPFLGLNANVVDSNPTVKKLFETDFVNGSGFDVNINVGGVAGAGVAAGVNVIRDTNENSRGIEERVAEVSKELNKMFDEVADGRTFEESSFAGEEANRQIFNNLKHYVNLDAGLTSEEQWVYMAGLRNAYIEQYRNILMNNAEGINFTGVGIAYLGAIVLPMLHFDAIETTNESVSTGDALESVITSKESNLEDIGVLTEYEGQKVMFVPGVKEVSAPAGVTYKVLKDGIMFGGVLDEINVVKRYSADKVDYALVLNGGNVDGTTYNFTSRSTETISDFSIAINEVEEDFEFNEKTIDILEQVKPITDVLNSTIDARVMYGKVNSGAPEFQRLYKEFRVDGSKSLEDVWNKFESMIGRTGKTASTDALNWSIYYSLERAGRGTGQTKLNEFRQNVKELATTPEAKMLILETLFGNLMKDVYVADKVNVSEGENEANFQNKLNENKRYLKFDESFTKEKYAKFLGDLAQAKTNDDWQKLVNLTGYGLKGDDGRVSELLGLVFNRMPLKAFEEIKIPEWSKRAGKEATSRRKVFDRVLFQEGIKDYGIYGAQEKYLKALDGAKSVETTNITDGSVIGFPVSAQLASGFRGVNPITGIIEVVDNGEKTFVDIKNGASQYEGEKNVVDLIPEDIITNIADKLNEAGADFTKEEIRAALRGETVKGLSFSYEEVFFKWGDCFNDAVGIKDLTINFEGESLKVSVSKTSEITIQNNRVLNGLVAAALDRRKKVTKTREEEPDKPESEGDSEIGTGDTSGTDTDDGSTTPGGTPGGTPGTPSTPSVPDTPTTPTTPETTTVVESVTKAPFSSRTNAAPSATMGMNSQERLQK